MRRLVTSVILLLALAGCGDEDKLHGDVVSKQVKAGYDFLYMMPMYGTRCSGNPSICTTYQTGTIPIWYHVPECYEITVKGPESGSTCLDEYKWNDINVGDEYIGLDVDPKDRKVEKD